MSTSFPLTRHFYRRDETCAALMWAIHRGRGEEALFWTHELIESDLGTELAQSLITIWAYAFGTYRLDWLKNFISVMEKEEPEREDFLLLAWNLAMTQGKDSSILALIGAGLAESRQPPDRMNCELTAANALANRKGLLAWMLLRAEPWDWDRMPNEAGSKEACRWLEENLEGCEYIARAAAVLAVTLRGQPLFPAAKRNFPADLIESWDAILGRRKRRLYKIPAECLVYITERGSLLETESTITEIRDELPRWVGAENPEFDRIFPDDIPDEWSLAAQEKSHGRGPLKKRLTRAEALGEHLRTWFLANPCRGCWGQLGKAIDRICEYEEGGFETAYEDINRWKSLQDQWVTGPIQKRRRLACGPDNHFVAL